MLEIRPIKTDEDYQAALLRVEALMDCGEELEVLAVLVADYGARHWPAELADPIEAIKFRMEQQGLKQVDLVKYFGSRSKVSEVLSGKQHLTLSMRQKLHAGLGIPAEVMLGKVHGG